MRKPPRLVVAVIALPFLVGCTGVLAQPVPDQLSRADTDVRGVVLDRSGSEEWIEYESTDVVDWTEDTLTIIGTVAGDTDASTRTFQLSEVEAVLTHQVDVNRTSLLVAGMMTGLGVLAAILFTGTTTDSTILTGG